MFDGVICEYELPLPKEMGELSEIKWNEFEFQTKSLNNTLDRYTIEDDGQIYKEQTKQNWVDDEEHPNTGYIEIVEDGIEKSYFSGEIIFYTWIPEEEYDNVFKPFYKIDKGRADSKASVGLGLSIASDIIRSHGGNIKLEKSSIDGLGVKIFLPV